MKVSILQLPNATLNLKLCGGLERVILSEMEFLIKKGVKTYVYASKVIGRNPHIKRLLDINNKNRILKFFYYINFVLKTLGSDVLHGHYTPALNLLRPNKSCLHFHGLAVSELPLYKYFSSRFHRSHYIFCAKHIRNSFIELYPRIPKDHLHVVYNGVDIDKFRPPTNKSINKIKKICFYGGWIPEKGLFEIVEATKILESRRKDFKIYFGGSAFSHYKKDEREAKDLDNRVRQQAEGLECLEFIGNILYEDLPGFLNKMDIGLVPSIYKDPFPLVPLEMMASGLPVVGFDLGGIQESVKNNITGILVENKNPRKLSEAIERYLDNPGLIITMGNAARDRIEQFFTWEIHTNDLIKVYEKICSIA